MPVKLLLRIANVWPLVVAFLILDTAWKLAWQHAAISSSPLLQKLAGAALFQKG
jgi:hypothetical protein